LSSEHLQNLHKDEVQNHHLEHIERFVMDVAKEHNCHRVTNNKVFKVVEVYLRFRH
jgi:hypothetical protein